MANRGEQGITIDGEVLQELRNQGIGREEIKAALGHMLRNGPPAEEGDVARTAGRVVGGIGGVVGGVWERTVGELVVWPQSREVVVIVRRELVPLGRTTLSLHQGFGRRLTSDELDQGAEFDLGRIGLKIPYLEKKVPIDALSVRVVNVGEEEAYEGEISGLGTVKCKGKLPVSFSKRVGGQKVVGEGNPIRAVARFGDDIGGALDFLRSTTFSTTLQVIFTDEEFRKDVEKILEPVKDTTGQVVGTVPTGEITNLINEDFNDAFSVLAARDTGLHVSPKSAIIDPRYPDSVIRATEANIDAQAVVARGQGEGTAVYFREKGKVAGWVGGITDGLGGPQGVATVITAISEALRNQGRQRRGRKRS